MNRLSSVLLLGAVLLLSGCNYFVGEPVEYSSQQQTQHVSKTTPAHQGNQVKASKHANLPPINSIVVKGNFDLEIIGNSTEHDVRIIGDNEDVNKVVAEVADGRLILKGNTFGNVLAIVRTNNIDKIHYIGSGNITTTDLNHDGLDIEVDTQGDVNITGNKLYLRQLTTLGSGNVKITNIKSQSLVVNSKGSGDVSLDGQANLRQLHYSGDGNLSLYWVDSPFLELNANGDGLIRLAGVVGRLDAEIKGAAQVDAKNLRAKDAFVKTQDTARADVWVSNNLHTLAAGQSNIFYYVDPNFIAPEMQGNGSVLRMVDVGKV